LARRAAPTPVSFRSRGRIAPHGLTQLAPATPPRCRGRRRRGGPDLAYRPERPTPAHARLESRREAREGLPRGRVRTSAKFSTRTFDSKPPEHREACPQRRATFPACVAPARVRGCRASAEFGLRQDEIAMLHANIDVPQADFVCATRRSPCVVQRWRCAMQASHCPKRISLARGSGENSRKPAGLREAAAQIIFRRFACPSVGSLAQHAGALARGSGCRSRPAVCIPEAAVRVLDVMMGLREVTV